MHSSGLALVLLYEIQQRKHQDPNIQHRAELLAARRGERRSTGRRHRRDRAAQQGGQT